MTPAAALEQISDDYLQNIWNVIHCSFKQYNAVEWLIYYAESFVILSTLPQQRAGSAYMIYSV
jgi:hypothetical protein